MAVRFAIKSGNWSDPTLWDNGALPLANDDVYANGFTVTIDQNVTTLSLRNDASNVRVPNIATPVMTGETTPSGYAYASGLGTGSSFAYNAFRQDATSNTNWVSNNLTGWLAYRFDTTKIIKRYGFFPDNSASNDARPLSWTFEGSNNGSSWTILDTQSNVATTASGYYSYPLTNSTPYTYYRLNISAVNSATFSVYISELEMTESDGVVLGGIAGGGFVVPTSYNLITTSLISTSGGLINFTGSTPITITGNYSFAGGSVSSYGIIHNGTGSMTINGNISGSSTAISSYGVSVINSGNLTINGNITDANGGSGIIIRSLLINNTLGSATITINGNVTNIGSQATGSTYTILVSSVCNLNITGDVRGPSLYNANSTVSNALRLENNATVNIVGFVYGGSMTNGTPNNYATISATVPCTVNVTGSLIGVTAFSTVYFSVANSTLTVTGDVIAGSTNAIVTTSSPSVSVTGRLIANGGAAISAGAGTFIISGSITASNASPALITVSANVINRLTGPFVNNPNGMIAVQSPRAYLTTTATNWRFTNLSGNNTIYTTDSPPDYPLISNVRKDISYNSGTMIGTMNIPPAASVSVGVPVDGTVGTAAITVTDIQNAVFDKAVSTLTTVGSIGARIKNAATVDIIGNILSSI